MSKLVRKFAILLICTVGLSGCFEDTIKEIVDSKFPPVDAQQYRNKAIATASSSLDEMDSPDVAAVLQIEDIRQALRSTHILTKANVKNVRIEGDSQLLLADIDIAGVFTSSMFPEMDSDSASILDSLKPNLVGVLKIGASITSAVAADSGPDLSLEFQVLPLFRELRIEELTVAENVELAEPADFIAGVINMFADNISGELSRAKFAKISVPASPVESLETTVDDSQTLDDGTKIDVSLRGKPVSFPFFANAISLRITDKNVAVLADLALIGEAVSEPSAPKPAPSFSDFTAKFDVRLGELVATSERPDVTWAAISKSSLSHLLNSGFEQANLCLDAEASVPRQEFSKKIEIPDENSIDCAPTKNCTSTRVCNQTNDCRQSEDCRQTNDCRQTADCRACLLRAPRICVPNFPSGQTCHGGHCIQNGLDPICQARKEGRRLDCERLKAGAETTCEAAKTGRRIDCERLKETRRLTCEAEKAAEGAVCEAGKVATKGLCETGKEALKRLSRTGNLANVDGFAQATGRLHICAPRVAFDPLLANVAMTLGIEGQADARVGVKWVSLDILGHVTCPANWTEHKDLEVTVPQQNVDVQSGLQYVRKGDSLWIVAEVRTSDLSVELRPKPRDLILQNYNMQFACPLIGGLLVRNASVVIIASEAVPELQGKFTFPGESRKFEFEIEPIVFDIPNLNEQGKTSVRSTEKAILVDLLFTQ